MSPTSATDFLRRSLGFVLSTCLIAVHCDAREPARPLEESPTEEGESSSNGRIAPAQLQQMVMDFSDQYVSALWRAFDDYMAKETNLQKRADAQKWKVMLGATSMTIAGSRDPRAGLLDMAVFISTGKWAVDQYWIPEVFGENAAPLRAVYREMDRRIWEDVAKVLTPAQQSDLRSLIKTWLRTNPPRSQFLDARLRNLDGVVLSDFAESASARGLLASIKRLLGKVDQSLLYGERVIFYMERTPRMLLQQSDLTIDRVAERFPIATVNPDFSSLSAMVENIPAQIQESLRDEEGLFSKSLPEVRASLESVERLTGSLQQTFDSANSLAEKVQQLPFEQKDYINALENTSSALTQLNSALTGLNTLLESNPDQQPKAVELVRQIDQRTERILDKAFQRTLILLGAFFGGVILCLFVAKWLFRGRNPNPTNSSQL